jgi:tetratricopeptide (TPR) repeat protein
MRENKTRKIDNSRRRIARLADRYYNEGRYIAALRLAHRELKEYGGDPDVFARLCDIYEGMGLQGSAINYWFRFLDVADESDLPDVYEGLAVNFLGIGNDRQSAYYYDKLIDADETLPDEMKLDVAQAFAQDKRSKYRFVYPPKLADYSKEITNGSKALKSGDSERAIEIFGQVAKGAKEYASAKEMQAIAYLLEGKPDEAEKACKDLLEEQPDEVRVLATLAAVYLEQGRTEESRALAEELSKRVIEETDDLYKVATVCCENGLHEQAYTKFKQLDKKLPYDGRMMYFKAVSAYKSGHYKEAENVFDDLCTIYPDAEVAKYYLQKIREYRDGLEKGESLVAPELIYFYHLPQEERENRCRALLKLSGCSKEEAEILGLFAAHEGYFAWCFDELDGGDHDLQYLALVTAARARVDDFLQDVLLDFEVADVLKVEVLRMLIERNEDMDIGVVFCNIYKCLSVYKISIGRKRRKKFIEAYAKLVSKFIAIKESYSWKIKKSAELLYRSLEKNEALDLVDNTDDCACAIYLLTGIHDLGKDTAWVASAFDANLEKTQALTAYARNDEHKEEKIED